MATDRIQLSAYVDDDGVLTVRDQHGRELAGLRHVVFSGGYEEPVEITVKVLAYRNGGPYSNRKPRKCLSA